MKMVPLGELTKPVDTWNPSRQPNSEFKYIDLHAVDNFSKSIEAVNLAVGSKAPSRARQLVATGDVLVSTVRPNLNAVAVVPPEFDGATASTGFAVLRPTEELDGSFLFHWVRSPAFVCTMVGKATGASYPAVSDRIVKDSGIPLPPLPEQQRIAAILDHADSLRAKRRQVLAHLDSLTQAVFHDMFSADTFEAMPAGRLMPNMRNGLSPARSGTYKAEVLTLSSVTQGQFDSSAVKEGLFASEPPADKRIDNRDFLMCRGNGNKALVGVGTFSRECRPDLVFPDTVIAGRVDISVVSMSFLEVAWNQLDVRAQIESVARTTNGTFKVNQQTLSEVVLSVPPLDLQERFASRIDHVGVQITATRQALAADDELFASLQSRAFRGEL